jgi:hypothetical protein
MAIIGQSEGEWPGFPSFSEGMCNLSSRLAFVTMNFIGQSEGEWPGFPK